MRFTSLVASLTLATLCRAGVGLAAPPEDLTFPVQVTNDATDAIPVTLLPGANIGVDGDVNVDGTVSVEPGIDPLVTMGAGEPVVIGRSATVTCGLDDENEPLPCGGAVRTEEYEVPSGKLLIIDAATIEYRCSNCSDNPRREAVLFVTQTQFMPFMLGDFEGISDSRGRVSEGGLGIHLSAGMSADAECVAPNDLKARERQCVLSIAGRLFDQP